MITGRFSVTSATLRGVEALPVNVEVDVANGLPGFSIVGMADAAVQESRERVRAALKASGFSMPGQRVVVNLAPSALRKRGSGFDLPIAIALPVATGQMNPEVARGKLIVGELSLQGDVRAIDGLLADAVAAKKLGLALLCADTPEKLHRIEGVSEYGVETLRQAAEGHFKLLMPCALPKTVQHSDFGDISGNEMAKRALQIAAAGNHGVLMMGPPGSGKTMLASCMPSIMPPLEEDEALEVALIHSVVGEPIDSLLAGVPAFRSPHHSATPAGLVGGGNPLRPGEISLAHKSVLFLDELPEFKPAALQSMRQPLESGKIVITRADGNIVFPCEFLLIAAANPCPCGYYGDPEKECTCTPSQIAAYQARIGGPLLDRIDMHIDVRRVPPERFFGSRPALDSACLREGVLCAREYASWRMSQGDDPTTLLGLIESCRMTAADMKFAQEMAHAHSMSGRGIVRMLSLARTISDISEKREVTCEELSEAITLRLKTGGSS